MEIFKIIGLALIAVVLSVLLRNDKPEISMQISIVTGIIIFFIILSKITTVISLLQSIGSKANIDLIYISTVLKIIGIAYITTFSSEICKDAGERAIASKIEFAGKILIMVLAVPIFLAVLETMIKIIP